MGRGKRRGSEFVYGAEPPIIFTLGSRDVLNEPTVGLYRHGQFGVVYITNVTRQWVAEKESYLYLIEAVPASPEAKAKLEAHLRNWDDLRLVKTRMKELREGIYSKRDRPFADDRSASPKPLDLTSLKLCQTFIQRGKFTQRPCSWFQIIEEGPLSGIWACQKSDRPDDFNNLIPDAFGFRIDYDEQLAEEIRQLDDEMTRLEELLDLDKLDKESARLNARMAKTRERPD